ncbi:Ig-like domain-containing protein [Weissella ceti]|uniref:Ig-like domain-containing protein n=1 Tax=Weissella ceti TaxID=759620 RepID=A0ABT3E4V5_9LACO|nr:Ig-like domain-containing protein [Weissella ceti]MCW0953450.1 Ig-like domain-containing protein [Weissella ceti]QVK12053.1 LPXTG cell wall anchor domain-containing protein [Weissella ceti]
MNKLKVFISMLAVVMGIGFATTTAEAKDITSEAPNNLVDNLKFMAPTLNQGEISSLTVSFSEKYDEQLSAGDTITLTLPDGIKGMLDNGQPSKIELKNSAGVVFGEVIVSEGKAVVTFSDAVEKLDNIRGHFNIAIIAENVQRETDLKVSPLNMGLPEKNSKGVPMNTEGLTIRGVTKYEETAPEGEFDYTKQGDMVTGVGNVRWFINVNQRQQVIEKFASDIVIKDTLGPGQVFKKDSFMVSRTKWNPTLKKNETSWVSIPELQAAGWVKVVKDPSVDGKSFEIILNVEDPKWTAELSGQSFALSYITDVTDPKLAEFTNNLDMSYQIEGKNPVKENKNYQTKNIRLDGAADGDTGHANPPLTLNEFNENDVDVIEETVEPLPEDPNNPQVPNVTEEPEDDKVTETDKPEILNDGKLVEEVLEEEQLEILDDIIQEHIEGGLEEGHTHEVEIDGKPEILTDEEIIDEILTPEQKEELKDVIERDKEKQKPEVKPVPEEEKPEPKPEVKPIPEKEKPEVKPAPEKKKSEEKKTESTTEVKKAEVKSEDKSDDKETLPETGYKNNVLLTLAGLLIAGFGAFFYKKNL